MNGELQEEIESLIAGAAEGLLDDEGADPKACARLAKEIAETIDRWQKHERTDFKVKYDQGVVSFFLWDLFKEIPEGDKARLAEDYAWDSPAWKTIEEAVRSGFEPSHESTLARLRLKFFEDNPDLPKVYVDAIKALQKEIQHQKARGDAYQSAHSQMYAWWLDHHRDEKMPVVVPDYIRQWISWPDVTEFLETHGIDLKALQPARNDDGLPL